MFYKTKDIAILLCKLRTSLSNEQIGFLFGCCHQTVSNRMDCTRKDLLKNLVPKFLNNNDRNTVVNNNTVMAKALFDIPNDKDCVIFDDTYRLAQKSKNFAGQKQLWSEQKKYRL